MVEISQKDLELITNALLFTACSDVCNDIGELDRDRMVDCAVRLKGKPTEDVYIYGEIFDEPERTKRILRTFKIRQDL